jgi:sulfocyanin
MSLRSGIPAALALTAALLAGCAGSKGKLAPYTGSDDIMSSDPAAKQVTLNLVGAEGSTASGFNFNGYANGNLVIRVPEGWTVAVNLTVDSDTPHSVLVTPWSERTAKTFTPAFPQAETPDYSAGIAKGQLAQHFSFVADKAGQYALVCGVPSHDVAGMWDELDVVSGAAAPEVLVRG